MTEPQQAASERRIALYGGSFNPPHVGHVQVVSWVLATQPIDSLWWVPTAEHAFSKRLAPFADRMAMCRAATADFAPGRTEVSDVERRMGGVSRTIDTVTWLLARHANTRFELVVGADIFEERAQWKAFDALERLCRFIVIGRRGYKDPVGHPTSPPLLDVSSTEIRSRCQAHKPLENRVPRAVGAIIEMRRLYR